MTLEQFKEEIRDYSIEDIMQFIYDNNLEDAFTEIIPEDTLDEEVNYYMCEYAGDYSWQEMRDLLNEIPEGYSYYRRDEYGSFGEYEGLDDSDVRIIARQIINNVDDDFWDPEVELIEEIEEDLELVEDEIPEDERVDDLMGFISSCSKKFSPVYT